MASRTMALNGVEDRIHVHRASVTEAPALLGHDSMDAVVCNPPYGAPGTTMANPSETLRIARHQPEEGLLPWYKAARLVLKGHGRFMMVYPAPRLAEALEELRTARLEPKRIRLVHPAADRPANLVLIEAVKDARPMLRVDPPLIVREADGSDTAEIRRIYQPK